MKNLALDFDSAPTTEQATALELPSPVQSLAAHFEQIMQQDDSPVRAVRHQPARPPRSLRDFPRDLNPVLRSGSSGPRHRESLHPSSRSVEHALAGRNVVVVTPTASGKTLCYNLPVVQSILADPAARAIYLFPTKALAEDQRLELQRLNEAIGRRISCHTYDGDTPQDARRAIREQSQHRPDESGHAAHRHPAAPHQMGEAV